MSAEALCHRLANARCRSCDEGIVSVEIVLSAHVCPSRFDGTVGSLELPPTLEVDVSPFSGPGSSLPDLRRSEAAENSARAEERVRRLRGPSSRRRPKEAKV